MLSRAAHQMRVGWSVGLTGRHAVLRRGGLGLVGGVLLTVMILMAAVAPLITVAPNFQTAQILASPGGDHWLGTDHLGRDMFSRMVWGSRTTFLVAGLAVTLGVSVGTIAGLLSGYYRGGTDAVVQRVVDALIAFPGLVLAMAAIAAFSANKLTISLTVGFVLSPGVARIVRGATLATMSHDFIEAAVALGASNRRIMFQHVLPNVTAPIIVASTVLIGVGVLIESSLSFLGFGLPPPDPTWGQMLSGPGRVYMLSQPWLAVLPGIAITLTVLCANLFGDSLRDVLDPRLR
ncbi:MAG: ABC transporter permease [Chloroflexi bacterium]|nr:ABC transporter permease [Chloroflexota bacterium]